MKKKRLLKLGVLALFFAIIMTSSIVAGTFAKFVSRVSGGARSQAAGFMVSDGTTSAQAELNTNVMIAPQESKTIENAINYFAQVNTQVSVDMANAITGYGALADFATLASGFNAWLVANGYAQDSTEAAEIARPASLSEMFTITISDGTNPVNGANLAEQIAGLIRSAGTLGGAGVYVAAMGANATEALTVNLVTTVQWNTLSDEWDTYVGGEIADLAVVTEQNQESQKSGVNVGLSITIQQLLGEMQGETLASTSWVFNATPNTSNLEQGRTYNINFTSNGEEFVGIERGSLIYVKANGDTVTAYSDQGGWLNTAYKAINITGGSNATLLSLRTWFEANATEKVVVPLVVTPKASLQAYTWAEVSLIAKDVAASANPVARAGEYNIAIGDEKTYTMTGETAGTYSARVVGIAHDDVTNSSAYGATKAGLTFETTECLPTYYAIDDDENISWANCTFRTTTLPTLLSAMESDLTSVIVAVNKTTANDCTTTPTSASVTSDTLWLMSKTEMAGESNQRYNYYDGVDIGDPIAEGSRYAYYSVNDSQEDRIKQRRGGNHDYYWLRSPYGVNYSEYEYDYYFDRVDLNGSFSDDVAGSNLCVAPCFCL